MKKIIAMAVAAVMMVSAASALDLEFGARAILGRNLDDGTFKEMLLKQSRMIPMILVLAFMETLLSLEDLEFRQKPII